MFPESRHPLKQPNIIRKKQSVKALVCTPVIAAKAHERRSGTKSSFQRSPDGFKKLVFPDAGLNPA
jgi:hypothetical protein